MNLLLDTHVLLWWLDDHPSLSKIDGLVKSRHPGENRGPGGL